jgi:cyclophilin family peptidyl-prolyl cis-trans isomerase
MTNKFQPTFDFSRCVRMSIPVLILLTQILLYSVSNAQTDSNNKSTAQAKTATAEEIKADFDQAVSDLRAAVKKVRRTGVIYYESESSMAVTIKQQWDAEAATATAAFKSVRDLAFQYFLTSSTPDPEIQRIVDLMIPKLIEEGQLTTCYAATKKLMDLNSGDAELAKLMGRISILTNDFEYATEYAKSNQQEIESFPLPERALCTFLDTLTERYQRELKIRKEETAADDLPHAIIETNKGDIVIELFENQAPETVGNFVSLIEAGFYDDMIFHHVLRNILANSGKMSMNRALPVGYTIYDESRKPEARHHFRGSVSMYLRSDEENVGGAEFQILMIPAPNMDGKNTVFGRVISDMRVVDALQETFMINEDGKEEFVEGAIPDTIKSITVKRLRPNVVYEPNPVKTK